MAIFNGGHFTLATPLAKPIVRSFMLQLAASLSYSDSVAKFEIVQDSISHKNEHGGEATDL